MSESTELAEPTFTVSSSTDVVPELKREMEKTEEKQKNEPDAGRSDRVSKEPATSRPSSNPPAKPNVGKSDGVVRGNRRVQPKTARVESKPGRAPRGESRKKKNSSPVYDFDGGDDDDDDNGDFNPFLKDSDDEDSDVQADFQSDADEDEFDEEGDFEGPSSDDEVAQPVESGQKRKSHPSRVHFEKEPATPVNEREWKTFIKFVEKRKPSLKVREDMRINKRHYCRSLEHLEENLEIIRRIGNVRFKPVEELTLDDYLAWFAVETGKVKLPKGAIELVEPQAISVEKENAAIEAVKNTREKKEVLQTQLEPHVVAGWLSLARWGW